MTSDVRLGRILGLPAVCGERVVGHVERAVPDETGRNVLGFVIRRGLGSAKWADAGAIRVLGEVSVILGEKPGRVPKGSDAALRTVKDAGGLTLGRVTDWWIRPDTMEIAALEVTLGLLEDLTRGRRTIRQWAVQSGEEGMQVLIPREEWENGSLRHPASGMPPPPEEEA
ncbi:MAG: hypothetical protein IJD99_01135 [Clostridia bacterium]|nr:hypothetical protein [Clostridia bacterium]